MTTRITKPGPDSGAGPEGFKAAFDISLDAMTVIEDAVATLDPADPPVTACFEVDEKARRWHMEVYFNAPPDEDNVRRVISEALKPFDLPAPLVDFVPIEALDWVTESQRQIRPIRAGRYFVHGSHARDAIPLGLIALEIDAGRAFGTGSHETTHGCLMMLDRLARRFTPRNVLDLGCGSGLLALAAWHTWRCPVYATDIDPVAVAVARDNAILNRVPASPPIPGRNTLRLDVATGMQSPLLRSAQPFDLVLANILMKPLCALAPAVVSSLSKRGRVVLSGLLNHQAPAVLNAYRNRGLKLEDKLVQGQWTTLMMSR